MDQQAPSTVIHHVSPGVHEVARACAFCDPVPAALGLLYLEVSGDGLDCGVEAVLISLQRPVDGQPATSGNGAHTALVAGSRAKVDLVNRAAVAHGGTDAGSPGPRPQHDAHFYAASVHAPDANRIKAATHPPMWVTWVDTSPR